MSLQRSPDRLAGLRGREGWKKGRGGRMDEGIKLWKRRRKGLVYSTWERVWKGTDEGIGKEDGGRLPLATTVWG